MPAPAIVQAAAIPFVGYPIDVVLPDDVTPGNHLVAIFTHSFAGCPPAVTDDLGNAWTDHGNSLEAGVNFRLYAFSAPITTGGPCTVTITASCGNCRLGLLVEVSGLDATPFDGMMTMSNTSSPFSAGGLTTTADGDLLLGMWLSNGGSPTITPTGGSVSVAAAPTSGGEELVAGLAGAAGPNDLTATGVGVDFSTYHIDGNVAAFKAAAAPSGVSATGTVSLPHFTASGTGAALAKASGSATLPRFTASGTAKATTRAQGVVTLPHLTGGGAATAAVRASGVAQLPRLQASGTAVGGVTVTAQGRATLPALSVSGAARVLARGAGAAVLPHLLGGGQSRVLAQGAGLARLPMFVTSGRGYTLPVGAQIGELEALLNILPTLTGSTTVRPRLIGTVAIRPILTGTVRI